MLHECGRFEHDATDHAKRASDRVTAHPDTPLLHPSSGLAHRTNPCSLREYLGKPRRNINRTVPVLAQMDAHHGEALTLECYAFHFELYTRCASGSIAGLTSE